MSNPQNNKDNKLPPQQGTTSSDSDKQSHFIHADQIINKWPEWKKNIRCRPSSINNNQSIQDPGKS